MPLHPHVQAMVEQRIRDGVPPLYTLTLAQARAADLADIQAAAGNPEPVHEVVDTTLPGPDGDLPVRIYRPDASGPAAESGRSGPLPVLAYYFGGGWTLGSIDTSDAICRSLANTAGCAVATVGYRLAPEHRFPAAVEDCFAAARWLAEQGERIGVDPARIAVGGDSAGGNLAAVVTLLARERGVPLCGQLLVYPNTMYGADTPSMRDNTNPALFNRTSVGWYWGHYLNSPEDGANPLVSPLRAPDLTGLPPALVITAEYDPLRDEGEKYAARLRESGVPVTLTRYDGMIHGFFAMAGTFAAGAEAIEQAAGALRGWFAQDSSATSRDSRRTPSSTSSGLT
jgi:acetyl esterase